MNTWRYIWTYVDQLQKIKPGKIIKNKKLTKGKDNSYQIRKISINQIND